MSYDFLIDHALKNVWCNPEQDRQFPFEPTRISIPRGVVNVVDIMLDRYPLPTRKDFYHVFQIGRVDNGLLNLLGSQVSIVASEWVPLSQAVSEQPLFVDVYTDDGIQLPKFETYYMLTPDNNLVIAVRQNKNIPIDFRTFTLFIRFYSNAYFTLGQTSLTTLCEGINIKSITDISDIQNRHLYLKSLPGLVSTYVNGFLVDEASFKTIKLADTVELVYDPTIDHTAVLTIGDLPIFTSKLDNEAKYLLHYPLAQNDIIYYLDDNDIYVMDDRDTTKIRGLYLHRNLPSIVRMVTHRDYSVSIKHVQQALDYLTQVNGLGDQRLLKVRLHVRKSGYNRPLVFEHHRIQELYKLPDDEIEQAMVGLDATVSVWDAATLEASMYAKVMGMEGNNITRDVVESAYGYNGIAYALGNTPVRPYLNSGFKQTKLPYGLQTNSTGYEYDADGLLIQRRYHESGLHYNTDRLNCELLEILSGKGTDTPDVEFGLDNLTLPINYNYRVYRCHWVTDSDGERVLDNQWDDITGSEHYTVVNNTLKWAGLDYNHCLMVRTDRTFLAYDLEIPVTNGNLFFTLSEFETRFDGIETLYTLPVPPGQLDIILNDHSLVDGIDYHIEFPKVVILNKRYLGETPNEVKHRIHVRGTGFCTHDVKLQPREDVGFVRHGLLSENHRFDIRDDRVLRIVVGGQVKHRDQLKFNETDKGITIDATNGLPYSIQDIVVPFKSVTNKNTYELRQVSQRVDKEISDYLSYKLPDPVTDLPNAIVDYYDLVSTFTARILNALVDEEISGEDLLRIASEKDILALCKPYEDWLLFDPITLKLDRCFVNVHPHNHYSVVGLTLLQYRFLLNVVRLYFNNQVDLSSFIRLKTLEEA